MVLRSPLVTLLLFAAVFGCATVATITQAPATAIGRLLLPAEEEQRLGNQLAEEVKQKEKLLDDPEAQRWIAAVGSRIVAAVPEADREFDFEILIIDDPQTINAFALPGGHLFIYSGLIAAAENEAEVASVVGHEVAHVTLDHPSQQLAAQVGVTALRNLALGFEPGMISQLATGIAAQGYISAYSRKDEAQADSFGLAYLAGAGYEPSAMAAFFQKLQTLQGESPNAVARFFASHPDPGDRVESIEAEIQAKGFGAGKTSIVGGFPAIRQRLSAGK